MHTGSVLKRLIGPDQNKLAATVLVVVAHLCVYNWISIDTHTWIESSAGPKILSISEISAPKVNLIEPNRINYFTFSTDVALPDIEIIAQEKTSRPVSVNQIEYFSRAEPVDKRACQSANQDDYLRDCSTNIPLQ